MMYLRNKLNIWSVHGIMDTWGSFQLKLMITLICKRPNVFMILWTGQNWIYYLTFYIISQASIFTKLGWVLG